MEPGGGLEEGDSVACADGPFAIVDGPVVQSTDGDGVVDVGGATVEPFDNMVNLTIHCRHRAAWRLAAAVAGQDGPALGWGE